MPGATAPQPSATHLVPVSAADVKRLCRQLGCPQTDPAALSAASTVLSMPLPVGWKLQLPGQNGAGEQAPMYTDNRTGQATQFHPRLKQAKRLLAAIRNQEHGWTAAPQEASDMQQQQAAPTDTALDSTRAQAAAMTESGASAEPSPQGGGTSTSAGLQVVSVNAVEPAGESPGPASELAPGLPPEPAAEQAAGSAADLGAQQADQPAAQLAMEQAAAQTTNNVVETASQPPTALGDPVDMAETAAAAAAAAVLNNSNATPPAADSPQPAPAPELAAPAPTSSSPASVTRPPPSCLLLPGHGLGGGVHYDFAADIMCGDVPQPHQLVPDPSPELLQRCGLSPANPACPQCLTFYSWWNEDVESSDLTLRVSGDSVCGGGLQRYYITISFDVASRAFAISMAAGGQRLAVGSLHDVTTVLGAAADVWDLHVGASLIILGRRVTLQKADGPTAAWNDLHAKRLRKLRDELQVELQKYRPCTLQAAVTADRGSQQAVGGLAIRHTVTQVYTLIANLREFRPSKADAFQQRMGAMEGLTY